MPSLAKMLAAPSKKNDGAAKKNTKNATFLLHRPLNLLYFNAGRAGNNNTAATNAAAATGANTMSAAAAATTNDRPEALCESCRLPLQAHEVAPACTGLALCTPCWRAEFELCAALVEQDEAGADNADPWQVPDSAELQAYEASWRARFLQLAAAY